MLNDIQKYLQTTTEVEKTNYQNLIESLQNNADVIDANRKEIEEQHMALIQAQQPSVTPEKPYVDSAFMPEETPAQPEYSQAEYAQQEEVSYAEPSYAESEEAPVSEEADDESFEYEDEEDDLFGE